MHIFTLHIYYGQPYVVHSNFRAGSTFPVPVCTVPSSMDRTSRCNKVDAVRLSASFRLNLLLLKGQRCVVYIYVIYAGFSLSLESYKVHEIKRAEEGLNRDLGEN